MFVEVLKFKKNNKYNYIIYALEMFTVGRIKTAGIENTGKNNTGMVMVKKNLQ